MFIFNCFQKSLRFFRVILGSFTASGQNEEGISLAELLTASRHTQPLMKGQE